MRHGTSGRRQRNRSNSNNSGRRNNNQQQRSRVYDSNGPDVRIRGTAHQVAEKYLALAKDATSAGDRIVAENYFQHAEHYIRLINEFSGSLNESKGAQESKKNNEKEGDQGNKKSVAKDKTEDLGLPSSILGPEVATEKKAEEAVD